MRGTGLRPAAAPGACCTSTVSNRTAGGTQPRRKRSARPGWLSCNPTDGVRGRNERQRGHADSPRQLIADAFAYLDTLARRCGHERVHLLGISWGGKLVAAMHAEDPHRTRSLTLVTPGLFPVIDVSGSEKLRIGWSMMSNPQRLFRHSTQRSDDVHR